tara:strand:- start:14 stop:310 length:297 start_codon:yes stop_codon:yes gene_type:complete
MAGTKTIDDLINQSQEPMDTGKSIDDIIKASDIAQFLSAAMSDKTNVDTQSLPIDSLLPGRTPMTNMYDILYPMSEEERALRLQELLRGLQAERPVEM